MQDEAFDHTLAGIASGLPRRMVLGGVLGLLGAGVAGGQSNARKRKKKKCKGGTTKCGKRCANLRTDAANCGACGTACPAGRVCTNGVCGCPAGQSLVQGVCIPTFGCTVQIDSCGAAQTNCPQRPDLEDAFCFVTPDGQPFCGDFTNCVNAVAECTPIDGEQRVLLSCPACPDVGNIGICALPVGA